MYKKLDKILSKYVEQTFRLFQAYRVLPFDEINFLKTNKEMWKKLDKLTKEGLLEIGLAYYNKEPHGDGFWGYADLYLMLRTPSPVLKYSYDKEFARKKERFEEALIATSSKMFSLGSIADAFTVHIGLNSGGKSCLI